MEHSATIGALAKALAAAQGLIEDATKDSTNPHFKSKYADLASVRAAIRMPLSKHGIAYMQGTRFNGDCVEVETILVHADSGEFIKDTLCMPVRDKSPQAVGSAITYGRRYSLMAMVGIAPDEDDDGNAAQGNGSAPARKWEPRKPTPFKPPAARTEPVEDEIPFINEPKEDITSQSAGTQPTDAGGTAPASTVADAAPTRGRIADAIPTVEPTRHPIPGIGSSVASA